MTIFEVSDGKPLESLIKLKFYRNPATHENASQNELIKSEAEDETKYLEGENKKVTTDM
jgi:hypothetical protein